jgi:hypothetical protein
MLMLWGVPGDSTLMLVRDALEAAGKAPFFLDQHEVLDTEVTLSVGVQVGGEVTSAGCRFNLADVSAVYLRPYETQRIPCVGRSGRDSRGWARAIQTEDTLLSWADLTSDLVINRPSAMAFNSSKPYQSARILKFGFEVPKTLLTTDPALVHEFREMCGAVIYKSVSSVRSVVRQLIRADDDRLENVIWCPTQFQELIRGVDYRVHVVGTEVFACRIRSNAVDYRYAGRDGSSVDIEAYEMPVEVAQSCVDVSRDMDLQVSGIDLRQREDGRWYCFEVNPSPAFGYFQQATGQDIAASVARLMSD